MRRSARLAGVVLLVLAGTYGLGRTAIVLQERDSLDRALEERPGRVELVDGRRVHLVERGAGPALVLLHGFGGSTFDWEQHVLEPLAEGHRVVAIDLWAHGFSERPATALDFVVFADQVALVLDALEIDSATIAGHSMGGAVAAVLAAAHPERVDRLILVGGVAPADPDEVPWLFRLLLTPLLGEVMLGLTPNLAPPEAPADYRSRMARVSRIEGTRTALLAYVRNERKRRQLREAYPRIRAPTLLLHGRDDRNVPLASVERVMPRIAAPTLVVIDGAGHWLLWEAPGRVVDEIRRFAAAPPRRARRGRTGP